MTEIPINLAVEYALSEAVLRQMLEQSQRPFAIGRCFNRRGYGYLKKILPGLNQAAKGMTYTKLKKLCYKY